MVAPTAVIDRRALAVNADELRRRAGGTPIRLASKSIRVRALLQELLGQPGFSGVLAYSAAEARWLVQHGVRDVVVAYPTVDRETLRAVSCDARAAREIAFMVDLPEHVDLVAACAGEHELRLAIDVDCSLNLGAVRVGAHRSRITNARGAVRLAEKIAGADGVRLAGLMFYDAQVAGTPDSGLGVRSVKRASVAQLVRRRRAVVSAVRRLGGDLEFVNAGGTGSLHRFGEDDVVTDLAAGSGLFAPTLFDQYDGVELSPAAFFVSPVVRKPADDVVVTFAGGYLASGPAGPSRVPTPVHPPGLKMFGLEGAGEVQTPLRGKAARGLRVGDPVWFRHAKAGEMCERFDDVLVLEDGVEPRWLPTYRGEGKNFG